MMKAVIAIAAVLLSNSALAADYRPLQGEYAIGGKTLFDAPPDEAQNTHLYVDLEGTAAHDLYEALPGPARVGVCGGSKDLTKRSGSVQCTLDKAAKEYHCAFGIELRTQRVVDGVVC